MKCQVLIDWLTFSVKETDPHQVIQAYLGMDPVLFQDTGYSLMGYNKVLRFSDILVCSDGREDEHFHDMGICVSMSGNGCRTFETMSKLTLDLKDKQGTQSVAFPALFQLLASDADANVSRIDIACDDRAGYLDMDNILTKTQTNELNSRMTKRSTVISFDGTQRNGATVYIGAPSSSFRVRIYDKALEQGEPGHWIRVELVMRSENAKAFVQQMTGADNVGTGKKLSGISLASKLFSTYGTTMKLLNNGELKADESLAGLCQFDGALTIAYERYVRMMEDGVATTEDMEQADKLFTILVAAKKKEYKNMMEIAEGTPDYNIYKAKYDELSALSDNSSGGSGFDLFDSLNGAIKSTGENITEAVKKAGEATKEIKKQK